MGSCCDSERREDDRRSTQAPNKNGTDDEFHDVPSRALRVQPVAFDVVLPENPSRAGADAKPSESRNFGMSCTLFDTSMHTVRDMSMAPDHNASFEPLANKMSNMSFTNSFKAVDRNAVREFMRNVARLAEQGKGTQSLLEESMSNLAGSGGNKSSKGAGGVPASAITQDDLNYISAGATLQDRIVRLQEVEAVLRQTIEGTWRIDSVLLQLAFCQVVPTLRQRRRPWSTAVAAGPPQAPESGKRGLTTDMSVPRRSTHASRQPVLVIHAPGVQMDHSMSLVAAGTPRSDTYPTDTSPNQMDFSPPDATDLNTASAGSVSRSRLEPPLGSKVEQYELLALTARDVDSHKCPGAHIENSTWDFLSTANGAPTLNEGKCIFRFMCSSLADVDAETKAMTAAIINLSSFKDEVTENNAPKVDVHDPDDASKYVSILVKTMYLLPGINAQNFTKDFVASAEYQKACQPPENKVQDCEFENNFRLTITVIRFIFSITVQFKVSEITDPATLESLAVCDGMVPAKVIMLERTKRHVGKTDATAKVRSMLLYYPVNDGVLVDNFTIVLNTSLPNVVSKIMNTFGSQGAAQSVTTVKLTREYLIKRFGDNRTK